MAQSATPEEIEAKMLELVTARGAGRNLDPTEIARALGGDKPEGWGPLMQPVRLAAVRLMKEGRITILRKGRPVDPDDFRGIYRLTIAGPQGEGRSSPV
jgi:hypothetical protein